MPRRRRRGLYRPDVLRELNAAASVIAAKRPAQVPTPNKLVDWLRYPMQRRAFESLMRERLAGFPWLAAAWADYTELQFAREASSLALKRWPAPGASERVRELGRKAAEAERCGRVAEYLLAYYEALFPFLVEFKEEE